MQHERPSPGFLLRPFWRDSVLSYVLIGVGFMLASPAAPVHRYVGFVILASGAAIFLTAVGLAVLRAFSRRDGRAK